ncbi:hypothetical protein [Kitasatospora sp. NPDC001175]|uniref:Uncharacterized protein n=1 Tax=Kitasatospora cystarginea TaxID=58350 RepID=A0ABN3F084_9ACTN
MCHFAHFPDPTSLHVCGLRARDVASADHLYAKSAAAAWLKARGQQASISYGTPLGSVVDIQWVRQARGLRLHLDGEVAPAWADEAVESVLGVSVPVDDETLVRAPGGVRQRRNRSAGEDRHAGFRSGDRVVRPRRLPHDPGGLPDACR